MTGTSIALIRALVFGASELARAGVPIVQAINDVERDGEISRDTWERINNRLSQAGSAWDDKHGGR